MCQKCRGSCEGETRREDYVLFCLDGVGRSHVVAGDVAALARRQGASEPPVAFSVADRQEERDGQQLAQTGQGGGEKKRNAS